MSDFMRPHTEPARTLYDAFQAEAAKRKGRTVEQWNAAEVLAVWSAACDYSQQQGWPIITLADVAKSERYAQGSADYGSKWAIRVAHRMRDVANVDHRGQPKGT